jgi:hypothetical protein
MPAPCPVRKLYDQAGNVLRVFPQPFYNLAGFGVPGVNDDDSQGYNVGSVKIIPGTAAYTCVSNARGAAVWVNQGSGGGGGGPTGPAGGDLSGTYPNPTVISAAGAFAFLGQITDSPGVGGNDYNPTGLSGATTLLINVPTTSVIFTGLAGGAAGREIVLTNGSLTGTATVKLTHNDAASAAANRFQLPFATDVTLRKGESILLRYDAVNSFWRAAAQAFVPNTPPTGAAGGDLTGTYPNPTILAGAVTYAKIQDISATQRLLGRNSGGAGSTEEVSQSQALDWLGSSQGQILYRNLSGWSALTPGTDRQYLQTRGLAANPAYAQPGPRSVTVLTTGSSLTYTTPTGCVALHVRILGSGAGGGGVTGAASSIGAGAGGGAGAYGEHWYFSPSATYTYTVGAAGAGGAAGNNAGGNGNQSSFGTLTAPGGTGGAGMAAGTAAVMNTGGAGATAGTNCVIVNSGGAAGGYGFRVSGTVGISGEGGSGQLGMGGISRAAAGAGANATGYGAGGSGALSTAGVNQAGGSGTGGVIVVEEYF